VDLPLFISRQPSAERISGACGRDQNHGKRDRRNDHGCRRAMDIHDRSPNAFPLAKVKG
jgi:hypothetical protein